MKITMTPEEKYNQNEGWTKQEVLEIVLLELNEAISRHINRNTCNVEIIIAPLDKSIVDSKEAALRKKVISFLKSQEIIQDYKFSRGNETIIVFDYSKNKSPEGKPIKMGVLTVECKVNPQKVIDYAIKIFEPKKSYCKKLAALYIKLINIVEIYFKEPIIKDERLNNFYTTIADKIKELINQDFIPSLKLKDWQPFTNLFSVEEEMERKGANLKKIKQAMDAFLGEIYKFVSLYDIEQKETEKIKELDGYLNSLKSLKEKQKKEPTSSKIEIIGMPPITIQKERQIKQYIPAKDNLLLTKNLKADITIGKLSTYNDGTIRYGKNIIEMRNQLKDLCRFFMRNPNRLLTIDDIKEEIVRADRRTLTSFATIAKYVSELHNSLKIHFKKDVIFNQREEGWYFKLPE